jgi:hypothetical protein
MLFILIWIFLFFIDLEAIKNESHTLRRKREDEEKQPKEK